MEVVTKRMAALAALLIAAPLAAVFAGTAAGADLPVYKPPSRGAPSGRVGAGTRSLVPPPQVWALAPDHTGLTTREQPRLYWYLSRPAATRVTLSAAGEAAAKPLLDVAVPSPSSAGVQMLDLARQGLRLQPGLEYRWSVRIEGDTAQRQSSAGIQRVEPGSALARRIEAAPKTALAAVFAEEGIWYDAIASISELIEQSPSDADLRRQREALLTQVGLKEAAAADALR